MSIAVTKTPATSADVAPAASSTLPEQTQAHARAIAQKLVGTPARYIEPACRDYPQACQHAAGFHEPSGTDLNETLRFFGLKRRPDGSAHLAAPSQRRVTVIPARTRENVAACAAVGLSFWSEAPLPNGMWAVDESQHAHLVKVDRRAQHAYVACTTDHPLSAAAHHCQYQVGGNQPYAVPATNDQLASLLSFTQSITETAA